MLGFVSKKYAIKMGMTHKIRLYGLLPGYGSDFDGQCTIVLVHPFLEFVDQAILGPLNGLACSAAGSEPLFPITIVGEITD